MSPAEIVLHGTLNVDGTLQFDEKPAFPPGRVTIVLRQEAMPELPHGDPFWQRMQAMWDAQKAAGQTPRSDEEIQAERRAMRQEWENHQQAIERLQEEPKR